MEYEKKLNYNMSSYAKRRKVFWCEWKKNMISAWVLRSTNWVLNHSSVCYQHTYQSGVVL